MWQFALSLAAISFKSILVNLDNRKTDEGIRGRTFERFTLGNDADEKKLLADHPVVQCLKSDTYAEVKEGKLLEVRRNVKREVREMALEGWVRNEGGEGFSSDGLMGGK
jgi:tRNA-specific adenosine deaminase 1